MVKKKLIFVVFYNGMEGSYAMRVDICRSLPPDSTSYKVNDKVNEVGISREKQEHEPRLKLG